MYPSLGGQSHVRGWYPARRGLGDFPTDYAADPSFAAAWSTVQQQLSLEGAGSTETQFAKLQFAQAYEQLGTQPQANPQDVLHACTQYALKGTTIGGAVDQIGGLISMAQSGAPPGQLLEGFTGCMMGIAVASGVITAGIGAAVVGVVTILATVLQNIGMFNGPPGVTIPGCSGSVHFNPAPDFAIGCSGAYGDKKSPGDWGWRHFPNRSDPADTGWFESEASHRAGGAQIPGGWLDWHPSTQNGGAELKVSAPQPYADIGKIAGPVTALIYNVWPLLPYVDIEHGWSTFGFQQLPGPVQDFHRAFLSAWKLNQEYALNGLQTQPDWAVFYQCLRVWNKAHASTSTYVLKDSNATVLYEANTLIAGNGGNDLAGKVGKTDAIWDQVSSGHGVIINTGARKNFSVAALTSTESSNKATAGMSTGAVVATSGLVAVAAGAVGLGIYAWLTHQAYSAAAKRVWNKVKSPFKKKHARRNPSRRFIEVRRHLASLGMTIKKTDFDDYVVRFKGAPPDEGYFTDDLDDAMATADSLARARLHA